jgi:hypothetical protein
MIRVPRVLVCPGVTANGSTPGSHSFHVRRQARQLRLAGAGATRRIGSVRGRARASFDAFTGMASPLAGVNPARDEEYRHMVARGFRNAIQGVTMHRPNEAGDSRAGS